MDITVILCTYNRANALSAALDSVLASGLPGRSWEILVVDNNCKDNTREVVQDFCARYPHRIRYVFEARQGLSNARNAGIREARGEIIAFMDDDVSVDPNWLQTLTAHFFDGPWSGAGGRVRPPKAFVAPDWLTLDGGEMDASGVLALFDAGNEPGELKKPPFGANMAFRRGMFEKYGNFRADLGRCGDDLIGNEDTEFGNRLIAAGEPLRYEPGAIVYHPVSEDRLNKRYFLDWWFAYGRAMFRQNGAPPPVWGISKVYFSLASRTLRWLSCSPWKPKERFFWRCRMHVALGELAEMRSAGKGSKPQSEPALVQRYKS